MICAYCGEEFNSRPIIQDGQIYCSVGCADTSAEDELNSDEFEEEYYYKEADLDLDYYNEEDNY